MPKDSEDSCSSSSSDSSEDHRRKRKSSKQGKKRKSEKKHKKHKKLKKEKRYKQKKRSKRSSSTSATSSSESSAEEQQNLKTVNIVKLPVIVAPQHTATDDEDADAFGPALPPQLVSGATPKIIGPIMPSNFEATSSSAQAAQTCSMSAEPMAAQADSKPHSASEEEEDGNIFGPSLPGAMNAIQIELEQRALELKLAAIEGRNTKESDQTVREEWMLELPKVGLKDGLASLSNMKRTFHQGKEKPDFSDRSSWTKTPKAEGESVQPCTSQSSAEELARKAQAVFERQRDAEQEAIARKHKKKHKRDESLVDIHQKKLRKEQKKREKELAESGAKPERRPFTRDVDLKLNKIDKNQTKQIVDKAKILNTKFSTGKAKYL